MSSYIILVDTKRKCTIRTTSSDVVQKLKKLNSKLWEAAHVGGRNCQVSDGADAESYTYTEYVNLLENEKSKLNDLG